MHLQQRIDLLERLGQHILLADLSWQKAKEKASEQNGWFTPEFVELASVNIANEFLVRDKIEKWLNQINIPSENRRMKNIGIVMAGNIPLVGFHDFLCTFLSGHRQTIKLSSKDNILLKHLVEQTILWNNSVGDVVSFSDMLKGCDAYIATGNNNSARYFEYYLGRYPNIIRRNRTSIAIVNSDETPEDLKKLAEDVYLYFGLGCRNVTKVYVPERYDFRPMLNAFKKYDHLSDHNKYKNNYDYQLAIHLINKKYYMTNGSIILSENKSLFSPISQLNYEYYNKEEALNRSLQNNNDIQSIVGKNHMAFGNAQKPFLSDFADGVNTLQFLLGL